MAANAHPPLRKATLASYGQALSQEVLSQSSPLSSPSLTPQKRLAHKSSDPDCGCQNPPPIVTQVGVLRGEQQFRGRISDRKPTRDYQLRLKKPSEFNLVLSGLQADVDVALGKDKNRNGVLDAGEIIATSELSGDVETISRTLRSGHYIVQVYQFQGSTRFQLVLTATPSKSSSAVMR